MLLPSHQAQHCQRPEGEDRDTRGPVHPGHRPRAKPSPEKVGAAAQEEPPEDGTPEKAVIGKLSMCGSAATSIVLSSPVRKHEARGVYDD